MLQGLIVRSQSGFFTVESEANRYVCELRGRLKKGARRGDEAAVGDWVEITPTEAGRGVIEGILPRRRAFSRLAPDPKEEYQQVLIANPDQVVFVFAFAEPAPHLGMLDRFLVIAEKQRVPAVTVANKTVLVENAKEIFGLYEPLGYRVIYTSTKTGAGIDELHDTLKNKISALAGPSGVGKSSLLNEIQPGLGLAVNEISKTMNKGKHTTADQDL